MAASAPVMFTCAARPSTETPVRVAGDDDRVVAVGAVDDDGVGLAVAGRCPTGCARSRLTSRHVGAGQVVDGDGVGAAQRR